MPTTKISAVVNLTCRDSGLDTDSFLKNLYVYEDADGDPQAAKRPAVYNELTTDTPADYPVHGFYQRKNTLAPVGPANPESDVAVGDDTIETFHTNVYGQFVGGGNYIYYSENNNINNWARGQALAASVTVAGVAFSYADDLWVVLDNSGKIWTADRTDLSTWTDRGTLTGYTVAYDLDYMYTDDLFIAVGNDGSSNDLFTSPDGVTWTARTNPSGNPMTAVACAVSYAVAVNQSGEIITSPDGVTWTSRTSVGAYAWNSIAVKQYGATDVWIAVGDSGKIMRSASDTPTSFTEITGTGITANLHDVFAVEQYVVGGDISVDFIAVGQNGAIYYSTDNGLNWTAGNFVNYGAASSTMKCVGPLAIHEGYGSNPITRTNPEAMGFVAFYNTGINSYMKTSHSMNGIDWFTGDDYHNYYRLEGRYCTVRPEYSNDTHTETLEYATSIFSYENYPLRSMYTKGYFAELYVPNNSVLGMMVPGDGVWHDNSYAEFGNGGMAFCIGNSRPILFHGYGVPDGDSTLMTYPFEYVKNPTEWLVNGIVSLDGYFFIMTNKGNIYHCDSQNYRKWPALNVVNAELEGDAGRGIAKHHNQILAFGQYTTEIFYDAANPVGSVLSRREDIRYQIGLAAPNTMSTHNEITAFIGQGKNQVRGVYAIDNFQMKKISTPYIDNLINKYGSWGYATGTPYYLRNFFGEIMEFDGNIFYVLNFYTINNSPITIVYDFKTGLWYNWYIQDQAEANSWVSGAGTDDRLPALSFTAATDGTKYIMLDNGKVYEFGKNALTSVVDTTNSIECIWQSSFVEFKEVPTRNYKRFRGAYYMGDKVTPVSGSVTATLQWTDDDYQNFSTGRNITVSDDYPYLPGLGTARKRAFKFTYTADADIRFNGIEIDFKTGTH